MDTDGTCVPCGYNKFKNVTGNDISLCMNCSVATLGPTTTLADNATSEEECREFQFILSFCKEFCIIQFLNPHFEFYPKIKSLTMSR